MLKKSNAPGLLDGVRVGFPYKLHCIGGTVQLVQSVGVLIEERILCIVVQVREVSVQETADSITLIKVQGIEQGSLLLAGAVVEEIALTTDALMNHHSHGTTEKLRCRYQECSLHEV